MRRRLDLELVRRGLAPTRERARLDIAAGRVTVGGAPADKPARLVAPGEPLAVHPAPARFVSRGGEKLAAALDAFPVAVVGADALDAGASTGGFTDCLLQRGAAAVTAVDVGRGQLDHRLRTDPRVTVVEGTNLRFLDLAALGRADRPFSLVVADLSFISLRLVAPVLVGLAAAGADLVVLVKPQFEAGRAEADRGAGVIRDPAVWRRVLDEVGGALEAAGAVMMGLVVSPLLGARGNVEFLAHLVCRPPEGRAGPPADKPARLVAPGEPLAVHPAPARFVSRGGEKLAAALDAFPVAVAGADALDAGASTGGFTDCLLQRGAAAVA
ncbi:MAG TPA: TlyA family rRNA (cytidine-2'-O)-methyltransferase, partial [Acidimicrobiales bacterium]|nr:TlyA family rRNA (cytidine-2'-O)-methyltransferase [Acidimicrobiales bacterium]